MQKLHLWNFNGFYHRFSLHRICFCTDGPKSPRTALRNLLGWNKCNVQHSVDELNLRNQVCSMGTGTSATIVTLASFCFPLRAGGESLRAGPLGVVGADHPPAGSAAPSQHVAPRSSPPCARMTVCGTGTLTSCSATRCSWSTARNGVPVLLSKLGHFDHLLKKSSIMRTSTNCPTCGTRASRTGNPRTGSTSCSTMCR